LPYCEYWRISRSASHSSDDAMRLLHVETLVFHEFYGSHVPAYAILSHRWEDEEVTYQDMMNCMLEAKGKKKFWGNNQKERLATRSKKGFDKIEECCRQATRDGLGYVWIDTFCIDKSSSAELTEAINSRYYNFTTKCLLSREIMALERRLNAISIQSKILTLLLSTALIYYSSFGVLRRRSQL
jgi:hypothetical protein